VRDQLEKLVADLLDKGVLYDDARREFEKVFITRALQRSKGSVGDAWCPGKKRTVIRPVPS